MFNKVTKDDADALTEEEGTFFEGLLDATLAPVSLLVDDGNTFVAKSTMGLAAVGYGIAGVMVGDRWGDSIPVIGGSR